MQNLSEDALAARRAYQREWNARNREKVKAKNARYWEKRARKLRELKEQEIENNER